MSYSKIAKSYMRERNSEVGTAFVEVPISEWPQGAKNPPIKIWRNRNFIAQLYRDRNHLRLSVNRTAAKGFRSDGSPKWKEGITWDELQQIKSDVGFGHCWAVECYPPDDKVINVANLRHLWLLESPPDYGWKNP